MKNQFRCACCERLVNGNGHHTARYDRQLMSICEVCNELLTKSKTNSINAFFKSHPVFAAEAWCRLSRVQTKQRAKKGS